MNPANLPNELDTAGETGLVWSIVRLGMFAVLMVWTVIYLLRKLPRHLDDGELQGDDVPGGKVHPDGTTEDSPE